MEYIPTKLNSDISIDQVVTIHYFEHAKDFIFDGERHDFWEILYVDKGKVEVMAGEHGYELKQGEIIFHKPNEFHNVWANGTIAPNIVVISFVCESPAMKFFEEKILRISTFEKDLLSTIIKESRKAFYNDISSIYKFKLQRHNPKPFGAEQLIKLSLEQLFISLYRNSKNINTSKRISTIAKDRSNNDIVRKIIEYLETNIGESLKFVDVLHHSNLSSTHLKVIFKEKTGMSVMEYFRKLKIDRAKTMIREEEYNITQIANILGYNSIHYFSKQFKAITDMSPTEYARSVKALSD